MKKQIIKIPSGKIVYNFEHDPLGQEYFIIQMEPKKKRVFLSNKKTSKMYKVPKGFTIASMNNNTPKFGYVTIFYKKLNKLQIV